MKKLFVLLLCALMGAMPVGSLAEAPFGDSPFEILPEESPEAPGQEVPPQTAVDTLTLNVNGEEVVLAFDSSPKYSSVEGGLVQASYYAYSSDGVTMYELYMIFPASARPGMVITPEYAALIGEESSVVLIISDEENEDYFFASLMDGSVYPVGSNYSISIDDIETEDGASTYSGRLSATLVALDMSSGEVHATLSIPETPFRFTLGGTDENRHADPLPTEIPADMRKV